MEQTKTIAKLQTNGFFIQPAVGILIGTSAGMGLMMFVILVGGHVFLAMGALFAGILGAFGILAGKMCFELNEHGFSRNFRPFLIRFLRQSELHQHFQFSDIVSYQREKDLSRSMNEVDYLRIRLRKAPFTILINDQVNPSGFRSFADTFEVQVQGYNEHRPPALPTQKAIVPIRKKKGFYSTVWANILTGIFVWATLCLLSALFLGEASVSLILRLALVIVPGTGYMVYRVFLKKDH
ncbi:MAG: hypothetical protein ACSHX9_14090 [Luteolibacter sp.]